MSCGGWQTVNGVKIWINYTSCLGNLSNTTDPFAAGTKAVSNIVPWYFTGFMFFAYIYILFAFNEVPKKWSWPGIMVLGCIISLMMVYAGWIPSAILNIALVGLAILVSTTFGG